MPDLDWNAFVNLPGDATRNWEMLCRGAVQRNYAQFGEFRSTAQQPGVEFHLKITQKCDLGDVSRWWGWQCRWYGLNAGEQIGTTRRNKIEESIRKTEKYLPNVTDWVLCTRRPLTPTDQTWFDTLRSQTKMHLHLWPADEIENLLVGEAAILRSTYFGELVLTPSRLKGLHEIATEPVRYRWDPTLHVEPHAEMKLRRILGERQSWRTLRIAAHRIFQRAELLRSSMGTLVDPQLTEVQNILDKCTQIGNTLKRIVSAVDASNIDEAKRSAGLEAQGITGTRDFALLVRQMRARKVPPALYLPALATECEHALKMLVSVSRFLNTSLVALIGKAGSGKTFLGAQLTSATASRPAGVFLLGRRLGSGQSLNALVNDSFASFDQMLEALDAAGARAGCRLPVVIDGLNESENPRDWKDLLASLRVKLRRFPNILVVVTLRKSAATLALPDETQKMRLAGFQFEQDEAIEIYFRHYKINAIDASISYDRFADPLFLRLFCEATNHDRQEVVDDAAIPGSLTAIFERYQAVATERVARILNRSDMDVSKSLEKVALAMWDRKTRSLSFDELRQLVGDDPTDWDHSLARALEEEGVLYRDPDNTPGFQRTGIQYDAFAGYLIADALITRIGQQNFDSWLQSSDTLRILTPQRFVPDSQLTKFLEKIKPRLPKWLRTNRRFRELTTRANHSHTLSPDILRAFAGLFPRRFHRQLWPTLSGPIREIALMEAAQLEGNLIDRQTANELEEFVIRDPHRAAHGVFNRVYSARRSAQHPLNSKFLDRLLRRMETHTRDLYWSEWLREHRKFFVDDVMTCESIWRGSTDRAIIDENLALWMSWILTTNVPHLRDLATRALYAFGLPHPAPLLRLTLNSCDIDDPCVPERLLAASYGVLMASVQTVDSVKGPCNEYLVGLRNRFYGSAATNPTNHWLMRDYVSGAFEFATTHFSTDVPAEIKRDMGGSTAPVPHVPIATSEVTKTESEYAFGYEFGFERHDIESLVPYDEEHGVRTQALQEIMTWIRGRVATLSKNDPKLFAVDSQISRDHARSGARNPEAKDSPYREKYAKTAYFEMTGFLEQEGRLERDKFSNNRISDVDVDPSFPEESIALPIQLPQWINNEQPDADWMRSGAIGVPDELLRSTSLLDHPGPWLAVSGFTAVRDRVTNRKVFGFVRGLLVQKSEKAALIRDLSNVAYPGNHYVPTDPDDHYVYAGEIPWSYHFASGFDDDDDLEHYEHWVGEYRGPKIRVETLARGYAWEDYHSTVNRAGGNLVPSSVFSDRFNLRRIPPSFDHVDIRDRRASLTFSTPSDYGTSHILYLREDLLMEYAAEKERELVWIVWGERTVHRGYGDNPPDIQAVYNDHAHIWRRVVPHSDFLH